MRFQFNYSQDEAKKIMPRIALCVNINWKSAKFPEEPNKFGLWKNRLFPTDNEWENREYFLFFVKNRIFESPNYVKISFFTSDINEIQTNSSSENPPTQIIIKLKNNISVWLSRGSFESVDVYINTEEK